MPRIRMTACAVMLVLGIGCSGTRRASRALHNDAAAETDGSGVADAGPDVPSDVDAGTQDAPADVQWMPGCATGIDGGALGAPEAIATGRPEPHYVGASSDGPVWTEARYFDAGGVVEQDAVMWFDGGKSAASLSGGGVYCELRAGALLATGKHFAVTFGGGVGSYCGQDMLAWANTSGAPLGTWPALNMDSPFALDDSHVYVVDFPHRILRFALEPNSGSPDVEPDVGGSLAADGAGLYILDCGARCTLERITHWGEIPQILADNVPGPAGHMGFQADDGAVFWQVDKTSRLYEVPAGSSTPRILVDDPDGVWGFTVDHDYVYWASGEGWSAAQGTIKRIRRCGGTPEVIAQGQSWSPGYPYPVGIAVGTHALYWVTGDGNIMRIRKLDAPDGGAASDASSDAPVDGAADTSVDAGVGVDSGVGGSGGG